MNFVNSSTVSKSTGSWFSDGGHQYITSLRFHVVPNRLLMASDLERLPAGTMFPMLNQGQELVVTTGGGGVPFGGALNINFVMMERPDLMFNLKMVVHAPSIEDRHGL
ncbi:hypothetical protein RHMOL_Rhmol02G0309000 [Rhododendron molle]|uniref:Uncharacterized protein n=1 Tax=Rhododendron molle TaxID=49168 RepID=A0ACC0PXI5_RHOML|nr:hypothetical protein RHMOL_Rhmol02G0309000 [Rhododendron molle]